MAVLAVLHKHIIEEITIRNETMEPGHAPFQLKPEIRFQVFPQKDKQPITTQMTVEIGSMDDNTPLYIKLRVRGLFLPTSQSAESAPVDPKEFHKQAFGQLFNTARTIIASATLLGGMTPINLPPINPDNLNIQKNS
ncbi:MAG: hypothetical protein IIW08_02840 [Clostridia bacterium]|nr:hypothetical protein [Clostridia bacterium]